MTGRDTGLEPCDVAVVGGGTAGLSLATELRRRGVERVVLLEREDAAGGVPRHCGHYPFGVREFGRLLKGPDYARRNVARAEAAGVRVVTGATVTALEAGGRLGLALPSGPAELQAGRVALCTGTRESTRAQRFIGGDRPMGVMTTGALQTLVYLHGMRPFDRPVILGSELVSFSAINTCRHAGIRPSAMIEENERVIARRVVEPYTTLMRVPLHVGVRDLRIVGGERVEAVTFTDRDGRPTTVEADGVIVSGRFRPEAALLRPSALDVDPGSGGPSIDQYGRCSDPAYFAAGNLLRPAESSAWCWHEGRDTAGRIADDLARPLPPPVPFVPLRVADPAIRFVVPQRLVPTERAGGASHLQVGLSVPVDGRLTATSGRKRIWSMRLDSRPVRRILAPVGALLTPPFPDAVDIGIQRGD